MESYNFWDYEVWGSVLVFAVLLLALLAGNPRWARVVGYALHNNPDPSIIPCHRVVNREGRVATAFAFGGGETQRALLEKEGVTFDPDGSIDLEKFGIFAE